MLKKRFIKNYINPLIRKILHNSAKNFIFKEKFDQLVVYSFDSVSSEINLNGIYEKDFLFYLKDYLDKKNIDTKNKTAIDIGAYIGNHSIFFSKIFKKVISFEPHPLSYEILKLNSRNNKNINVYNFGCSDTSAKSFLRMKHTNVGGSTISDGSHERDYSISLIKLDDFLTEHEPNIGLIKIDVEGHEKNVINGCLETLKKNRPIIIMELKNFQNEGEPELVKKLKSIGYLKFYEIEKKFKLNKFENNKFLAFLDKTINLFFKNPTIMKEIKDFKKKEYQNIIII